MIPCDALAFGIKAAIRNHLVVATKKHANRRRTPVRMDVCEVTAGRQALEQLPSANGTENAEFFAGWYLVFNVPALPRKQTVQAIARESFL